jgi:hypothetical protein
MKNVIKSIVILLFLGMVACDNSEIIAPIPPSDGDIIEPSVGGPDQPNQVFIDLSKGTTTVVPRKNWDFGFSTNGEFRVIINYSAYMVARPTDQTDLAMVSSNLVTPDYKAETVVAPEGSIDWIDNPNGVLTETAIAAVSASDSENLVYVINLGQFENGTELMERGFIKVKITRSGDDYVITYGDIDATTFTSITISKNANYNFTFLSVENGMVNIEPEKNIWDIAFTTSSNHFFDHATSTTVPYRFKDLVITNKGNVKVSAVEVTDIVTYDDFTLGDMPALELLDDRMGIGSSWRLFEFSTFSYQVNPEIFYVIEDTDGNYYKMVFTRMNCITTECAGERGYPEFTYELLK